MVSPQIQTAQFCASVVVAAGVILLPPEIRECRELPNSEIELPAAFILKIQLCARIILYVICGNKLGIQMIICALTFDRMYVYVYSSARI